eukprot:gnl/TRDRNA2_/TRDRNA2_160391_c2_seq1.p1 gnl/TRDRNA2_/TRDRNA2_160391_c2~~gnl/TRDRNA2_/TRDRNA2_160391_c2_seq1.p1  ORF type:complete len:148 (-),score=39.56 gnl/TRDRNA2_/TRDRNA2_160391_c2_seq1:52-495(-)
MPSALFERLSLPCAVWQRGLITAVTALAAAGAETRGAKGDADVGIANGRGWHRSEKPQAASTREKETRRGQENGKVLKKDLQAELPKQEATQPEPEEDSDGDVGPCSLCHDTGVLQGYGTCPLCDGHGLAGVVAKEKEAAKAQHLAA